jgi:hypothetical protein
MSDELEKWGGKYDPERVHGILCFAWCASTIIAIIASVTIGAILLEL